AAVLGLLAAHDGAAGLEGLLPVLAWQAHGDFEHCHLVEGLGRDAGEAGHREVAQDGRAFLADAQLDLARDRVARVEATLLGAVRFDHVRLAGREKTAQRRNAAATRLTRYGRDRFHSSPARPPEPVSAAGEYDVTPTALHCGATRKSIMASYNKVLLMGNLTR